MKLAIVTLTKGASELGNRLCDKIGGTLYCSEAYLNRPDARPVEKPFKAFAGKLFEKYDGIVFIMATGIVVRSLAPYIVSKVSDPAVIVMDEAGKHAISLLSGHLGGGNALAHEVAKAVGGVPVITTASDVTGNLAVDMLAKSLGAGISSMERAKDVTAIGINGGLTHIFSSRQLPESVLENLPERVQVRIEEESMTEAIDLIRKENTGENPGVGAIFISTKDLALPEHCVQIIPKTFVVGIGCRKNAEASIIHEVFHAACKQAGVHPGAVRKLATIGLKAEEKGIHALMKELGIQLDIIEIEDIKKVQHQFDGSDFVEKTIGARAVAEPCAMLAARDGFMRLRRYAERGVTIAIWEEDNAF